jgi:hypothetical protein
MVHTQVVTTALSRSDSSLMVEITTKVSHLLETIRPEYPMTNHNQ